MSADRRRRCPESPRRADRSPLQHPAAEPRLRGGRRSSWRWSSSRWSSRTTRAAGRGSSAPSCGWTPGRRARPRSRPGGRRSARNARSSGPSCAGEPGAAPRTAASSRARPEAARTSSRGSTWRTRSTGSRRRPSTRSATSTRTRSRPRPSPRRRRRGPGRAREGAGDRRLHLPSSEGGDRREGGRERLVARREEVQTSIEKLTADFRRRGKQNTSSLQQDTLFKLRNSPILDMVNPSLRVQQVQLPDHFNNVNFMRIPRVDRCRRATSAADRKGFEDAKLNAVFRSHPRQDLMVGSESPHPYNLFGCTPCHGGRDRASSFWSAGHSPETPARGGELEERARLEVRPVQRDPDPPDEVHRGGLLPLPRGRGQLPEAPTLDAGIEIVEGLGCWGCHRIEGLERQGLPRVGPSLEKVASKVPREWTTRWVMDPDAFRPNTKMPKFFYLENFVERLGSARRPRPRRSR